MRKSRRSTWATAAILVNLTALWGSAVGQQPATPYASYPGSIGAPPGYMATLPGFPEPAVAPQPGPIGSQPPPSTAFPDVISVEELAAALPPAPAAPDPWTIGDYKIVPYGALWADMIYATERTNPGAFTLFALSPETEGESVFTIDARRTRVGFNLTGPDIPLFGGAKTGGNFEVDFFGQFISENQAGFQMRHAYWEAKNERWRMLVGQTSDVISPLIVNTVNYSVGWMGGNIGFRRPQFRWERYLDFSPTSLATLQVSLNHDIVPDFSTSSNVKRESASWPVIESRLGWTLGPRGEHGLPIELGVSGHIGRTQFDFHGLGPPPHFLPPEDDAQYRTWSFNIDVKAPITECWGVQGEFFTGANLSPFLGGIGQGVCSCVRGPVRASGGWLELWYDWSDQWHSHAGFGIDDPNNRDMLFGRTYNSFIFANVMYDITKKFTTGFEVSFWKTSHMDARAGLIPPEQLGPTEQANAVVFDWMFKYGF